MQLYVLLNVEPIGAFPCCYCRLPLLCKLFEDFWINSVVVVPVVFDNWYLLHGLTINSLFEFLVVIEPPHIWIQVAVGGEAAVVASLVDWQGTVVHCACCFSVPLLFFFADFLNQDHSNNTH